MTFKEQYRDYQELAREHNLLRQHNLKFKPTDPQGTLLLFAEGTLIIVMLERFLRMLPDLHATDDDMLYRLFKRAVDDKVLAISDTDRKRMVDLRNAILHGNFEQVAEQAGVSSKEQYFKTKYDLDIDWFYTTLDGLVDQIDPNTGCRKQPL